MKNIKELFNNARTKVTESKAILTMKGFFNNLTNNKLMTSIKTKTNGFKELLKGFAKSNNAKDSMNADVSNRFSSKFKKVFKNIIKKIQTKANSGNMFAKCMTIIIKTLSIIATIAFAALVIYCIKDVFLYCLMLVATCAAVALCIEFILSILSIAIGCKI